MASKLRKGDNVIILAGKDKGKKGEISKMFPKSNKALVSGVNVVIRHTKQAQNSPGGKISKEAPIHISNIALIENDNKVPSRIGFKFVDGKKVRYSKKSGEVLNDWIYSKTFEILQSRNNIWFKERVFL